ncbi:MAG: hypothetical protein EBR88_04900 [Betaproteobacteria bacterium]|nr:hypothetical protein [Betaproteobacteria bacterium]
MRPGHFAVLVLAAGLSLSSASAAQPRPIDSEREAQQAFAAAVQALGRQDWVQAELYLERTLMYAPRHAEARLELALLLAQRGRAEAAVAFIESLVLDPGTPEEHRGRLSLLREDLLRGPEPVVAPPEPRRFRVFFESSLGRASNPLAGTSDNEVSLTFPGGPVVLPIDTQDIEAVVRTQTLTVSGPQGLRMEAQTQDLRGKIDRSSQRMLLSRNMFETRFGMVSATLTGLKGVYGEHRLGVLTSLESGRNRFSLGWTDEPDLGRQSALTRAERALWLGAAVASLEHEHALESGPSATRFGLSGNTKITNHINIFAAFSAHFDHSGYSIYLGQNAPRRMVSGQLVAERAWALYTPSANLGGRVEGFVRVHASGRTANISLFSYKDLGANLGIRLYW